MPAPLRKFSRRWFRAIGALVIALLARHSSLAGPPASPHEVTRLPVVFSEGHATEEVDHGRPVVLIAAALGVTPEVFRDAFRGVHPAGPGSGGPTDAEARRNKAVLMDALGKYGVTDERLNAVSGFYRYPPGRGGLWKHTPATANALVKDGVVVGYELTSGGAGYTTPPVALVPGIPSAGPKVEITFSKDLERNGTASAILIPPANGK